MSTPDVSVVIPTHGRCSLLSATVESVLRQADVDFELLVVDDGSPDDTQRYLSALTDARIRIVTNEQPLGVSRARNRGVAAGTGRWVAFLDDDDLWAPSKLAKQLEACRAGGRLWGFSGAATLGPNLEVLDAGPPPQASKAMAELPFLNAVPAGASNVLVLRDALKDLPFDPELKHVADWDLWIRLAQKGEPAIVSEPLVAYRIHPGNASLELESLLAEVDIIERRYSDLRGGRTVDRAYIYRWIAWGRLRAHDRRGALNAYLSAVRAGDMRSVPRAIVGLTYPGIARRSRRVRSAADGADLEWLKDPALR